MVLCSPPGLRGVLRRAAPQAMEDEWVVPQGKRVLQQVSQRPRAQKVQRREFSEHHALPLEP
jgi:hypothetical protein